MDKPKLNIRFHNPNSDEDTLKYISQVFTEASKVKFENILCETATKSDAATNKEESRKK
jgi:hypothetical protein